VARKKKEPQERIQSFLYPTLPDTDEKPIELRQCTGNAIPGLDAELCQCPVCLAASRDGIWWYSAEMRDPKKKRERIGAMGGVGDIAVEDQGDSRK
jgi:hypothetical protein